MQRFTILGREPALWVGALAAALSLGTAVQFPGLSEYQVAALVGGLNAASALAMGILVRPVGPAIFTNVVAALAAIGTAYGFEVSGELVGGVNFLVLAVLTLITRGHVSPTGSTTAVAPPAAPPVIASRSSGLGGQPPG